MSDSSGSEIYTRECEEGTTEEPRKHAGTGNGHLLRRHATPVVAITCRSLAITCLDLGAGRARIPGGGTVEGGGVEGGEDGTSSITCRG